MKKILKGEFEYKDGKLSFTCHTSSDMNFDEVETGLIKLRNEIERQLMEKVKCPFFPKEEMCIVERKPHNNVWNIVINLGVLV